MRLDDAPESSNVEDDRGSNSKYVVGGGAGIVLLVLGLIFGVDFGGNNPVRGPGGPPDEKTLHFVKKVLGTTEEVWKTEFNKMGKTYKPPHMDLFSNEVHTGCGDAPSAVGPFYCPKDQTVYLDPTFFNELEQKLGGSKAEFSQAYVIAHEVGHHVQNLLGYMNLRGRMEEHDFSVRLELQADYLAGVWAHYADQKYRILEPGDVESAIKTANSIGDDRLQKQSGHFVQPEKFTHGSSAQRVKWFTDGLKTGDYSKQKLDHFFKVPSHNDL